MRRVALLFLFVTTFYTVFSQGYENEIGFKYMKAEYMISTQRYEDAIVALNDIIKSNPAYEKALLLRGETKYKLAAYKGAKIDALAYIENQGINYPAAAIIGKAEFAMSNYDAALNSLITATSIGGDDDEKLFEMMATIYDSKGLTEKACNSWNAAANLGSTIGAINANKNCGVRTPTYTYRDEPRVNNPIVGNNNNGPTDSSSLSTSQQSNNSQVIPNAVDDEEDKFDLESLVDESTSSLIPQENNTANEIYIDEDLTLAIFGQGLGLRKVLDRPSILILADEDGGVAIDVCVNENGRVESAEYNGPKSTIGSQSLISLAIRKSKEFWFEKSDYPKQCGVILFKIKGS